MTGARLEICVDTPAGIEAAVRGGADRIELCSALALGGLTPGAGLLAAARGVAVPVFAMIRPRAGDFVFDGGEETAMMREIDAVREAGLAGVVLGASRTDATLDEALLRRLCAQAHGLGQTLHRAFDLVPDPLEALDAAAALGFERVLTSGGAPAAADALPLIRRFVERAAGRIAVMPGGGVRAGNAAGILRETGAREIHSSARAPIRRDPHPAVLRLGFADGRPLDTCEREVRALRAALGAGR